MNPTELKLGLDDVEAKINPKTLSRESRLSLQIILNYVSAYTIAIQKVSDQTLHKEYLDKIEVALNFVYPDTHYAYTQINKTDVCTQYLIALGYIIKKTCDLAFCQDLITKAEFIFNQVSSIDRDDIKCFNRSGPLYVHYLNFLNYAIEKTASNPQLSESLIKKADIIVEKVLKFNIRYFGIFGSHLNVLVQEGNFQKIKAALDKYLEQGYRPTCLFLKKYIKIAGNKGNIEEIMRAWLLIRSQAGINTLIMIEFIKAVAKTGDYSKAQNALDLVKELKSSPQSSQFSPQSEKEIFTAYKVYILGQDKNLEETSEVFAQKILEIGRENLKQADLLADFARRKEFYGPQIDRAITLVTHQAGSSNSEQGTGN